MAANMSRFVEFGKKIVAVGRNYSEHAKELGNAVPTEPVLFLKPTTSYITRGQSIVLPVGATELHHEVELGLVIGKTCKNVPSTQAMDAIAGYAVALDMTNRSKQEELKKKGLPWSVAKGFDTSCPIGDFVPKERLSHDVQSLNLWLKVNGELRQQGCTKDMLFKVPELISYISSIFTLEAGDLILTGTPSGVGPVKSGDTITAGIDGMPDIEYSVQ